MRRTRIAPGVLSFLKWDSPPEYENLKIMVKRHQEVGFLLQKLKKELDLEGEGMPTKYDELLIRLLEKQFEAIELAKSELEKAESLDSKFFYRFQDLIDNHNLLKSEMVSRFKTLEVNVESLNKSKVELLAQLSTLRWMGSLFFAAAGLWISWLSLR